MRLRIHLFFMLSAALVASGALAQAVVYTTPELPVADPQPGVLVQILENDQVLEQSLFPVLSDNPAVAEHQAKQRMQQPDWQLQEARLNRAYPTCKQWWSDADVGLKPRLLAQVKPDVWQPFKKLAYSKENYEEAVLRALVSPRNMQVSQFGRTYPGYGGNTDPTFTNALARTGALFGHSLASLAAFPAFDSLRQALPMVQAILLMALVICIPLVTVFSAYSVKTVLTLTFAQFGLMFLTFWWELARWLDGWMLTLLYDGDAHSSWNLAGIQNTQDDLIMQFVMGTMFIVLPAFWMGALGWAGVQLGGVIERAAVTGSADANKSGGSMGDVIAKKIGK
ncbi:conjugal transfer protein TraG [Klebsiella michiganensis]|uniref:conjugal transfer protein TraG N-terminal domain-containing protein n=1 Tax=Klebsiella michiganensis TaxID=1134687 RepID=UPI001C684567|nr:conjugal transfer protein TraG [Klebsiella michiganensis]